MRYGELLEKSRRLAGAFAESGLRKGDHMLIFWQNKVVFEGAAVE